MKKFLVIIMTTLVLTASGCSSTPNLLGAEILSNNVNETALKEDNTTNNQTSTSNDTNEGSINDKKNTIDTQIKEVNNTDKAQESNAVIQKYTFPAKDPVRAKVSKDKYSVKVIISEQKIHISKNGEEIKTIPCSTGLPGKDNATPIGHFKINNYYGQNFYNAGVKEGARYWVGFKGAQYLFHSVPTDEDGSVIATEAAKIGSEASHGCVRMSIDDAYWFYENIPQGSDVTIQN